MIFGVNPNKPGEDKCLGASPNILQIERQRLHWDVRNVRQPDSPADDSNPEDRGFPVATDGIEIVLHKDMALPTTIPVPKMASLTLRVISVGTVIVPYVAPSPIDKFVH